MKCKLVAAHRATKKREERKPDCDERLQLHCSGLPAAEFIWQRLSFPSHVAVRRSRTAHERLRQQYILYLLEEDRRLSSTCTDK